MIPICRECTVLYSEPSRLVVTAYEEGERPFTYQDQVAKVRASPAASPKSIPQVALPKGIPSEEAMR